MTVNKDEESVEDIRERMSNVRGSVGFTADHAPHVEFPTSWDGEKPPFNPIRDWVVREWGNLDAGLKEAARNDGTPVNSDKHVDEVTWLILNSIAANGQDGVFMLRRAVNRVRRRSDSIADRFAGRDDEDVHRDIIQEFLDEIFHEMREIVRDEAHSSSSLYNSAFTDIDDEQG